MEKIPPADRADFSLGEKSRERSGPEPFLHHHTVVMGSAEQTFSASATTEQEGAERRTVMFCAIRRQKKMEILTGGPGIPEMKLQRLAFLHLIADGNGAEALIGADQIAHQEVSPFESASMLVDDDPDMKGPVGVPALRPFQRLEHFLKTPECRLSAQLVNQISLRLGDDESFADRATALGNHGSHRHRAGQLNTDESSVEHLIVSQETIFARSTPSSDQTPHGLSVGIPVVQDRQHIGKRCAEWIGQENERGVLGMRSRPSCYLDLILHLGERRSQGEDSDLRKARSPEGQCCGGFQFFFSRDNPLPRTAKARACLQLFPDHRRNHPGIARVMRREEDKSEIHGIVTELLPNLVRHVP